MLNIFIFLIALLQNFSIGKHTKAQLFNEKIYNTKAQLLRAKSASKKSGFFYASRAFFCTHIVLRLGQTRIEAFVNNA